MALGDANGQVLLDATMALQAQRTAGAGAGAADGRCRADLAWSSRDTLACAGGLS
jgi:hypothetical protein